ncbi:helix-turn-helix domain-containing protein [Streptomyces sp. NPDC056500]|uniref:helix-turn-helix domain-containing protein n=1 Tax=Streptomyces sp. NPDC056500 TaxID=3345840 RepID=UPI0036B93FEE
MAINTAAMFARQRFGQELKKVRLATRIKGTLIKQIHVAQAMGLARYDRYSRIERGESWPTDKEWKAIVRCLQMDLETRTRLGTMRTEGVSIAEAWWTAFDTDTPEPLITFVAYEDAAQKITTCVGSMIPGLLQTADYARTVTTKLASYSMAPQAVDRSVEFRANRRRVFEKALPPTVEAIIGVAALHQRVGGIKIMTEQLDSLVEDAEKRRVVLRIVPFSAPAPVHYTFNLIEFPGADEEPIAAFDTLTGMSFLKSATEVRGIRGLVRSLRGLALDPTESLESIKALRNEMSRV